MQVNTHYESVIPFACQLLYYTFTFIRKKLNYVIIRSKHLT